MSKAKGKLRTMITDKLLGASFLLLLLLLFGQVQSARIQRRDRSCRSPGSVDVGCSISNFGCGGWFPEVELSLLLVSEEAGREGKERVDPCATKGKEKREKPKTADAGEEIARLELTHYQAPNRLSRDL